MNGDYLGLKTNFFRFILIIISLVLLSIPYLNIAVIVFWFVFFVVWYFENKRGGVTIEK